MGDEERVRLRTLAAFRVDAGAGPLRAQISLARASAASVSTSTPPFPWSGRSERDVTAADAPPASAPAAEVGREKPGHGLGGFDSETGDYLIDLGPGDDTPVPWVNIVAREGIGFAVTESGGSFTWGEDAGEFRLTPWHNDPVLGLRGEVLYLRDEDRGAVWTPGPGPLGLARSHKIRHGWGRSRLEARSGGIEEQVSWCLHPTLPVKLVRVRLRNMGDTSRLISATFFADWVLGSHPLKTAGRLQVRFDRALSAVVVRNPFSPKFSRMTAFLASDRAPEGMATDRQEFLGSIEPLGGVREGLLRSVLGER